jgi:predicted benzoate:H+ symporter BenE
MLLLLLKTSIATLILAIGMTAVTDDIVYLWRRPVLLIKSIIGLALLIAANARDQHALELVVAYLLASAVVSIPYVLWIRKRRKRE